MTYLMKDLVDLQNMADKNVILGQLSGEDILKLILESEGIIDPEQPNDEACNIVCLEETDEFNELETDDAQEDTPLFDFNLDDDIQDPDYNPDESIDTTASSDDECIRENQVTKLKQVGNKENKDPKKQDETETLRGKKKIKGMQCKIMIMNMRNQTKTIIKQTNQCHFQTTMVENVKETHNHVREKAKTRCRRKIYQQQR